MKRLTINASNSFNLHESSNDKFTQTSYVSVASNLSLLDKTPIQKNADNDDPVPPLVDNLRVESANTSNGSNNENIEELDAKDKSSLQDRECEGFVKDYIKHCQESDAHIDLDELLDDEPDYQPEFQKEDDSPTETADQIGVNEEQDIDIPEVLPVPEKTPSKMSSNQKLIDKQPQQTDSKRSFMDRIFSNDLQIQESRHKPRISFVNIAPSIEIENTHVSSKTSKNSGKDLARSRSMSNMNNAPEEKQPEANSILSKKDGNLRHKSQSDTLQTGSKDKSLNSLNSTEKSNTGTKESINTNTNNSTYLSRDQSELTNTYSAEYSVESVMVTNTQSMESGKSIVDNNFDPMDTLKNTVGDVFHKMYTSTKMTVSDAMSKAKTSAPHSIENLIAETDDAGSTSNTGRNNEGTFDFITSRLPNFTNLFRFRDNNDTSRFDNKDIATKAEDGKQQGIFSSLKEKVLSLFVSEKVVVQHNLVINSEDSIDVHLTSKSNDQAASPKLLSTAVSKSASLPIKEVYIKTSENSNPTSAKSSQLATESVTTNVKGKCEDVVDRIID